MVRDSTLTPFDIKQIASICRSLKTKKAPGYDGITTEHLKYAGEKCLTVLTKIFNAIIVSESIPPQFK